jgi:hypothetical protein
MKKLVLILSIKAPATRKLTDTAPSVFFRIGRLPWRDATVSSPPGNGGTGQPAEGGVEAWQRAGNKLGVDARWEHCIMIFDGAGNLVDAWTHHRAQVFDENGKFLGEWKFGDHPSDIHLFHIMSDGYLWAADRGTDRILKYDLDGTFMYSWGTWGPHPGGMWGVHGLSVDTDGNVYVAEVDNGGVQKYRPRHGANAAFLVGNPIRSAWK